MTTDWIAPQALNCALLVLFGVWLVYRYDRRVLSKARRESLQYQLFTLRDRLVMLVAKGTCKEEDPQFQELYSHVNQAARATSVDLFRSAKTAFSIAKFLAAELPTPPQRSKPEFDTLPKPLRRVWKDYVNTVVGIFRTSISFRAAFWLAVRYQVFCGALGKLLSKSERRTWRGARAWMEATQPLRAARM